MFLLKSIIHRHGHQTLIRKMSTTASDAKISLAWADSKSGEFNRQVSSFRNRIPSEQFPAERNRYHLYVSYACPWAHRTLIFRALKGLEECISISVVHWLLTDKGWSFDMENCPGATGDTVENKKYLSELYLMANPNYSARFTVPVLWDKKNRTIVNNESSEIIRMLNFSFNEFSENPSLDLYPEDLRAQIDDLNQVVYDGFNNGVYKSGFATKQEAYSKNCLLVFETLDKMEQILEKNDYLVGNRFTEADVRAFVTSVRFDPVYFGHFKCNLKSIEHGYPSVLKWMKRIYNHSYPKIANTINMDHIKHHYYCSHIKINPTQIVPLSNGPNLRE